MIIFINLLQNIIIFSLSFFITFFLIPVVSKIAFKFNIIDKPDGKLKLHETATPYLGGVAVFLGFFISLILFLLFDTNFEKNHLLSFLALFFLLIVGLIDDIFVISPSQKILGQSLAILFFFKANFFLNYFPYNFITIPLSFFWYLTVINAFNLVDVMDGLTSTIAITSTVGFIFLFILLSKFKFIFFLASFLGSIIAFFCFNKPKAKIYLGDSGSLFIGGFFALVPFFLLENCQFNLYLIISSILILLIPLLELIFLIIIRCYKKIPFYLGSPDHFSIYLQKKGWSKQSILVYVALLISLLSIVSYSFILFYINFIVLLIFISLFLFGWCKILF